MGQIYEVFGIKIALPEQPDTIEKRSDKWHEQYWERTPLPEQLRKIKSVKQWNNAPGEFREQWAGYLSEQYDNRDRGYWFYNREVPTYITGSHWMYIQWSMIDIGYPEFREANRILYLFWEACKVDARCFGICYLKIRRSGFSFMSASEIVNIGTLIKRSLLGMLSKTGTDAKKMFQSKVVPIATGYPFFFKPIQEGMDRPKTELSYRVPATRITKSNMYNIDGDADEGLETTIDWRNTANNSYDSEKLRLLLHDEAFKWEKPGDIRESWGVTKTCLRVGRRIIGKCMMGSTCNAQAKGGKEGKELYYGSDVKQRSKNGRTKTGLYNIFIPFDYNAEGFIDRYGHPVIETPEYPIMGIDGELIIQGSVEWWNNEAEALKDDPDALNEFYRQNPRTEGHAFRDDTKESLFDLTKIYDQIDHNDKLIMEHHLSRGNFKWRDGVLDTEVEWHPHPKGRFIVSWHPPPELRNKKKKNVDGLWIPENEIIGAFGADTYDISGVVGGGGSNGAMHGLCKFSLENAPTDQFFLEYISRPPTAEIFFEDLLMAMVYYGMPVLAENNKIRFLHHIKNRGYRRFSMNRPDKRWSNLSKTEREVGGIPNSSESVKQAHATAIESYIDRHVGYDRVGRYRNSNEIGQMLFQRTLNDWAKFDINKRTMHDASISSGLAIMACQKHLYLPEEKVEEIICNFGYYSNDGYSSHYVDIEMDEIR